MCIKHTAALTDSVPPAQSDEIESMKLGSSLRLNLGVSWLNHGVGLLIGVVLMPFVLHTLGDESYGTWIFINSVAGYSSFLYLGFGETVCRYVARFHAKRDWDRLNQVVNIVFFVYLAMGVIGFTAAAVLAWFAPDLHDWGNNSPREIQWVIVILGLNILLAMSTTVFGGVLTGIQRIDIERGLAMLSGIVRLILTVVFLTSEWGLLKLSLIFLMVTLAEHLGHVVFAFIKVPTLSIGLRHFRWSTAREFLSFSAFAFLDLLSGQFLEMTDTVIIGVVLGAKATVPYYIAMRLCKFISLPIQQIGRVFMPRAGELHATGQGARLRTLVTKGVGFAFLLIMGFFIGAAFFGDLLIETWIGAGYAESHLLLLILLGSHIVATPAAVLRSVLFGMGYVKEQSLMNIGKAVTNVVLSVLLIHRFGVIGVAVATAIPVVLVELGMLVPFALKKLQFEPGRLVREALAPQLLALLALLSYSLYVASSFALVAGWPALMAVSIGGGCVLGLVWLGYARIEKQLKV